MSPVRVAALLVLLAVGGNAANVLVFGDSWGSSFARSFENMFVRHGRPDVEVHNAAIGTTARFWARTPDAMVNAIRNNGGEDITHVWLTITGNDAMAEMAAGRTVEDILEDALNNTAIFVDPVLEAYPNIKVVAFGYDIVDFSSTVSC